MTQKTNTSPTSSSADSYTDVANASNTANDFILTPPAVFPYKVQQQNARARIT